MNISLHLYQGQGIYDSEIIIKMKPSECSLYTESITNDFSPEIEFIFLSHTDCAIIDELNHFYESL